MIPHPDFYSYFCGHMRVEKLNKLKELLAEPKKIVITTHRGPDGDAMGSSLGLYNYLFKKGHQVQVITPNDYPSFLHWMKGNDHVIQFVKEPEAAERITKEAEIIFCLDFNTLSRIDTFAPFVEQTKAFKVLIDHHQQPDEFDFTLSDTSASSTAQLIYEFLDMFGDLDIIDQDIAECLYTGIMTDTGNFRFPSVTAKTHEIVAFLIKKGAKQDKVYDLVNDNNSINRLNLLGYCLKEKLEVIPEYATAIISLTSDELNRFQYQKGDTEGVVNYALSIKGISVAAFFVEREGIVKISFRSKGDFSVNQLARDHFNGGGHINAAGGSYGIKVEEAIEKFRSILPDYQSLLNNNKNK